MNLHVISPAELQFNNRIYRCAIGKNGFIHSKIEGDNCTPVGTFALRECWWREDKLARTPKTALPLRKISLNDGWCDAPADEYYNRHVTLPFATSHEKLWREDNVYDVIVPLGYNDNPIVAGKGSAIFMHVAKPEYEGTEGCVALALPDLLEILSCIDLTSKIIIAPAE
ncbi:MAG: L,D-transpeptidase family protein [Alphaproteobacteria bacterium]|nr:L,D-transpeptidase family protein [Alphaproteobacteria bacterium]